MKPVTVMNQASVDKPLVFACSGCSRIAQVANDIAVSLQQNGRAQMACISGIGGNIPSMVEQARSGVTVIAIDGCNTHCVKACLEAKGIPIHRHLVLAELGIATTPQGELSMLDSARLMQRAVQKLEGIL